MSEQFNSADPAGVVVDPDHWYQPNQWSTCIAYPSGKFIQLTTAHILKSPVPILVALDDLGNVWYLSADYSRWVQFPQKRFYHPVGRDEDE